MNDMLSINKLSIFHKTSNLPLLDAIDLTINDGEIVALVGASGSGKSLITQAIFQLLPDNLQQEGTILFRDLPITPVDRGSQIALIPQSIDALDPLMTVGKQIQGLIQGNNPRQKMLVLLSRLGLKKEIASRYPFELSGGQARRILVAIALGSSADVIIADEPTPGLDDEAKAEMLTLLKEVQSAGKSMLLITHDFDVAINLADRIAVMEKGKIIEVTHCDNFEEFGENLYHPFTKKLWNSLPQHQFYHDANCPCKTLNILRKINER
ncbi:dipeptide transport ATP-binding protein DppD [Gracilibacillus boraciitolerans JCM 21714]|uniref:Nickel import system ATP-binding protein NikD n=1 Tax=Gracilibacillus boraciitolerans JCM 21714 TaxID=1298598 RepID=W4VFE5_9BACI|nr:ABC transporter ATP-binding protein [Gracilibacillus boraciitolerans]GAE91896.1 dipeptide transport ATP-binding protein DppD [Gracilibacillus boraciitolerans JCM 21714]